MSENDELGSAVNTSDNSLVATTSCEYTKDLNSESDSYKDCLSHASSDATMSVDVIKEVVSDEVKSVGNINSEDSFKKEYKMAELEKKIKNEVLKTEDIEKKLKEAEAREEALLKRITENQKTITKMTGVLEAYEKTIAELIAEKQQIIESYEKKCADLQNERDLNFTHLTSLEGTFTDLHAKYERSKQITTSLKKSEESLIAEKKQCFENLRLQEQRYEKMKSHAMQQLELANSKLDVLSKTHAQETAKLKALLKKEEISRLSTNEQKI
uniref:Transforming acidic coiled-coil-containing protein C-terminal domain-containing protein n=1 Tax=Phlebotomus papatasi TaxID=29031 RepID=A0A1B0CZ78_PHLPP